MYECYFPIDQLKIFIPLNNQLEYSEMEKTSFFHFLCQGQNDLCTQQYENNIETQL